MQKLKILLVLAVVAMTLPSLSVWAGSMSTTINNQTLTEGGSASNFQLRLSAKPSSGNNVSVSWQTDNQCHVSSEGRGFTTTGQVLTTSDKLELSARAVDDVTQESTHECSITYRTASADSNLHNLSFSQKFTILDNGDGAATPAGFYSTVLGPNSITEGSSAIYSFAVGSTTSPSDSLIISASATDGQCELIVSGQVTDFAEQTIKAGSRGTAIFSVRATNDSDVEGAHSCSVAHSLRTNDLAYSGLNITSTEVPIIDDESPYSSQAVDNEIFLNRPEFGLLDAEDANNDGVKDKEQLNLGAFVNQVSGRRQAVEAIGQDANCNAISTPSAESEDLLEKQNSDYFFPHGLVAFRVICDKPGATAEVKYYLDDLYSTADIELQKYSANSGYAQIEGVKITEFQTQNGLVSLISYQITDGGELDEDGQTDGTITDPMGIAISSEQPQTQALAEINRANESNNSTRNLVLMIGLPLTVAIGSFAIYRSRRGSR
jgi:hypothetical protein